jgi:trimeric autotransporter adhesin
MCYDYVCFNYKTGSAAEKYAKRRRLQRAQNRSNGRIMSPVSVASTSTSTSTNSNCCISPHQTGRRLVSIHGDSDDSSSDDSSSSDHNNNNSTSYSNVDPNANDSSDSDNDSEKKNNMKQNNGHTATALIASKSMQQQQQHCSDDTSDTTSVCYSSGTSISSSKTTTATANSAEHACNDNKHVVDNTMRSDDATVCTSPQLVRISAKHVTDTAADSTGTASTSAYTVNSTHSSNDTADTTTSSSISNSSRNDNTSTEPLPTHRTMLKLHQLSSLSSFGSSDSSLLDYSSTDVQNFNETILLKLKTPPKIERYRSTGDQVYNSTTAAATTTTVSGANLATDDNSDDGFADDDNTDDANTYTESDTTAHLQMSQQVRSHSQSLIPSQQQSGLAATVSMPQSLLHSNRSSLRRDHSLRKTGITNDVSMAATVAIANDIGRNCIGHHDIHSTAHDISLVLPYRNGSMKQSTGTNSSVQNNRLQQSAEQHAHVDSNNTLCSDDAVTPERSKRTSSVISTTNSSRSSSNSSTNAPSLMQQPIASVTATTAAGTTDTPAATAPAVTAAGYEPLSPTPRCISCPLPSTARTTPTRTLTPITRKTGKNRLIASNEYSIVL